MKEIKIKGWIARDLIDSGVFYSDTALYSKKPKLADKTYEDDGGFTESLFGSLERFKGHIEKGECRKVEIIIREIK